MINYYLLTKPGIILGNLITFAAGFLLASRGVLDWPLFLSAFIGLGFIIASACVVNNTIDRHIDKKMERTKRRALASGLITPLNASLFALLLAVIGNIILYYFTNFLAIALANTGFFIYIVLYTLWKRSTVYGTAIGSVAGAIPPIVGYTAACNQLDLGALILFSMLVLWQMPHFFAIALYRYDDYVAAGIPVLPIERGIRRTKIHMALYIVAFMFASTLLTHFNYTGRLFATVALVLGAAWLLLSMRGFSRQDEKKWGWEMFAFSLVTIIAICLVIPLDVI